MSAMSEKVFNKITCLTIVVIAIFNIAFPALVKADEQRVEKLAPSIDTYVYSGSPNESFCNSDSLEVGQGREIYMKFDLSSLNGSVTNAVLYLSGTWTTSWVGVYKVKYDGWTENITHNTRPSHDEHPTYSFFLGKDTNYVDITGLIKEAELSDKLASFAIINTNNNRPILASTRSSDVNARPYLQLTITDDDDEAAVAETKYSLLSGVDVNNVTGNLTLNTTASNGTTITWSSSNERFVTAAGRVTRPPWFMGTQYVTLTAVIAKGQARDSIAFNLVLPAEGKPDITSFSGSSEILFGNAGSETEHITEQMRTETLVGAYGEAGRKILPDGGIAFTLKCDPTEQNYFTAKFYGEKLDNEGYNGFSLFDENGNNLSAVNNESFLMFGTGAPFENRFVFSTFIIPKDLTEDREYVTLILKSYGNGETRCIYSAYCHTGEFPDIDVNEMPGEAAPIADPPAYEDIKAKYTEKEWLKKQANDAVRRYMIDQIFPNEDEDTTRINEAWNPKVTFEKGLLTGLIPSGLVGCVPKNWGWNYELFIKNNGNNNFTGETVLSTVYPRTVVQNMTQQNAAEIFALAYTGDWFEFKSEEEREEMLLRVLYFLDFCCKAQGANGGYQTTYGGVWIGGPNRQNANAVLEGFGQQALGRAFELVYEDANRLGLLDEKIDDDNDDILIDAGTGNYKDNYFKEGVTPRITRREAYERMFRMGRDFLTTGDGAGHAPNQDMADIVAALYQDNALKLLGSSDVWNDDTRLFYCRRAVGEENGRYTQSRWVSPKGTILEANGSWQGGYSGDYGALAIHSIGQIAEIAAQMGHNEFGEYAERAWDTIGYFMSVGNMNGSPYTGTEGVITWRNTAYPRIGRCVVDTYSALTLKSPMALRTMQYYFDLNTVYATDTTASYSQAHGADAALEAIRIYLNYDDLREAAEEARQYNYRYKGETDEDFFFSDEVARSVAFRNNGELMYMAMQWRHVGGQTNDMARLHFTTEHTDHIASIKIESPEGLDGYYVAKYKDYLIVMNSSDRAYTGLDFSEYTKDFSDLHIKELSDESVVTDLKDVSLPAWTTRVFYFSEKPLLGVYPFVIGNGSVTKKSRYNNDALLIIVSYDDRGALKTVRTKNIPSDLRVGDVMQFNTEEEEDSLKCFIFDSLACMTPLAKMYSGD